MRKRFLAVAACVLGLALARPAAAQSARFVVIVNSSNSVAHLAPRELSRLFRKDVTRWGDGSTVVPLDLPEESGTRADFSQRVHGRPTQAMVSYWQQQIFSGRAVPPLERKNDGDVIDYVSSHAGAIGYVSSGARLPAEVKVVPVQ